MTFAAVTPHFKIHGRTIVNLQQKVSYYSEWFTPPNNSHELVYFVNNNLFQHQKCVRFSGKSPKLAQGYFLCKNRRISWRKDAQKLDLRWSDRGSLRGDILWGHGVRELSGQPSAALRSPEMEQTTLSRLRVKYEVVTPLGDEDILDWREIAEIGRFWDGIVPIRVDSQDCLRSGLILYWLFEICANRSWFTSI